MNKLTLTLAIAIILLNYNIAFTETNSLNSKIDYLLTDSILSNALTGVSVYDITDDSSLFEYNADKLLSPASNLKLFTTAAVLEMLGPEYRFATQFYKAGDVSSDGRLNGDLIIVGGGDPLISGRFRESITEVLELWADSLLSYGINEINGDIIVDNSFFTGQNLGTGWAWDDLSYWYACQVSPLSFNDNCVDLKFLPGEKVGDAAIIELTPKTDYIIITNNAKTVHPDSEFTLDYFRIPFTNNVTFFGGIPLSDSAGEVDYVSVHKPEIYCATIFSDILKQKNIMFNGRLLSLTDFTNNEYENYESLAIDSLFIWHSDSMGVVISVINSRSQNFFAEQAVLTLGNELGGEGSYNTGLKLIELFFDSLGITTNDLAMYDGSGLSHQNLVKPDAIIRLLDIMSKSKNWETYYNSIRAPRARRLRGVEFRENVRVKGGTIANTRTYSGYISGPKTEHLLAFSIMVNNYSCLKKYVEKWQDKIIEAILKGY